MRCSLFAAALMLLVSAAGASPLATRNGSALGAGAGMLDTGPAASGGGGGPGGALTSMTAIETTGATRSNVTFSIGVPFAAGAIGSGQHIVAVDGISGSPLVCDETLRYSDVAPAIRGERLSCVIPSLPANATDTIALSVASGAPATGTDISPADILATAFDMPVSLTDETGGTFTASPRTALASGNAAWVNTTTAAIKGKWASGGGINTGYILYVPLMNGATPHPRLFVVYDVECYKAATGAVGSGNPILGCTVDVVTQSGVVQNTSAVAADDWYGISVGPGGSCSNNFAGVATPAQTLTLAANTANTTVQVTASAALWTSNSPGNLITDGTGLGVISAILNVGPITSATTANIGIMKPFASTSLTPGSYKIYPISHPYMARYRFACGWTPSGSPGALRVQNGNLYLGSPWNPSTLTGGPFAYLVSARALLNYSLTASAVTNIDIAANQGANPSGYIGGPGAGGNNSMGGGGVNGSWKMSQETTGDYDGLGAVPGSYLGALVRYDSLAAKYIFRDADLYNTLTVNTIDSGTGATPSMTNGQDYAFDSRQAGASFIQQNNVPTSIGAWAEYPNALHTPDPYYIPAVLTGDWYWTDSAITQSFTMWTTAGPGYGGTQLNRIILTGAGLGGDRSDYHAHRNIGHYAQIIPDANTNASPMRALGWTKTDALTNLENQYTARNSNVAGTYPTPGTNIQFGIGTCPSGATCSTSYQTPGPRFIEYGVSSGLGVDFAEYMQGYGAFDEGSLLEKGMLSANGLAFFNWMAEGMVSLMTDSTEVSPVPFLAGYWWLETSAPPPPYTWSALYHTNALTWQFITGSIVNGGRVPPGTMTLSAVSGAAITVTVPTGYLGAGSWYNGGWVSSSDGGYCQIVAVTSPTTFTCNTTAPSPLINQIPPGAAFGATSYTNTNYATRQWSIPYAAIGDTAGLEIAGWKASWTAGTGGTIGEYAVLFQGGMTLICEYLSVSGCPGAATTVLGYTGGAQPPSGPSMWMINHR